ncbi:MAG: DNA repair protein RecO [Candidatus Omnitrophica bacterium]|nr:DNA repair protein RecO [Candidatus Omnitrophota bacterium]
MAIISTEALVLRVMDHRETSRLAFFFTKKCGKVIGVLKGIRKDPKKFGSSVDKFSVNDIVFYQYRNSEIHLVSQCDMKEFFYDIRRDDRKITAAEYAAELVNKIMPLEERNPAVYDLLIDYLRAVGESEDLGRMVRMFQVKILSLSGFRPHIDSCVRCGKDVKERSRFSMIRGGLLCSQCEGRDHQTVAVSAGSVATLLYIEKNTWSSCLKLRMPAGIKQELGSILNNFLVFHLGKNIRSSSYLSKFQ